MGDGGVNPLLGDVGGHHSLSGVEGLDEAGVVEGEDGVERAVAARLDAALASLSHDVVVVPVEAGGDAAKGCSVELPSAREDRVASGSLDGRAVVGVMAVPYHAARPRLHAILADGDGGHARRASAGADSGASLCGPAQPRCDVLLVHAVKVELGYVDGSAVDASLSLGWESIRERLGCFGGAPLTHAGGLKQERLRRDVRVIEVAWEGLASDGVRRHGSAIPQRGPARRIVPGGLARRRHLAAQLATVADAAARRRRPAAGGGVGDTQDGADDGVGDELVHRWRVRGGPLGPAAALGVEPVGALGVLLASVRARVVGERCELG